MLDDKLIFIEKNFKIVFPSDYIEVVVTKQYDCGTLTASCSVLATTEAIHIYIKQLVEDIQESFKKAEHEKFLKLAKFYKEVEEKVTFYVAGCVGLDDTAYEPVFAIRELVEKYK